LDLGELHLGKLGHRDADARLLWAVAIREGRVGRWLTDHDLDAAEVEAAFPGSEWG
jgi:hypothetical protein